MLDVSSSFIVIQCTTDIESTPLVSNNILLRRVNVLAYIVIVSAQVTLTLTLTIVPVLPTQHS